MLRLFHRIARRLGAFARHEDAVMARAAPRTLATDCLSDRYADLEAPSYQRRSLRGGGDQRLRNWRESVVRR